MEIINSLSNLFSSTLQLQTFGLSILMVAVFIEIALAFAVLRSNPRSATNLFFFFLSVSTIFWLVAAYIVRLPNVFPDTVFLARLGIFFAAPMSSLFFLLAHTFPNERINMKRWLFWAVIAATALMMALNISPYAFTSQTKLVDGSINPVPGPGLAPFAILSTIFSVLAIYFLIQKFRRSSGTERNQLELVLTGMLLMLGLVIITILVPILFFGNGLLVVLAPVYTLVFFGMTAYAIVKYGLFNLKVIATEALTFVIWITLFANIFVASSQPAIIIGSLVFVATLIFGIVLIGSIRKEVEQREELQTANAKLDAVNQKLEELSHFKTQLLSLVSHQLRSPLAAIKGFISLLLDGSYGPIDPKAEEAIGKVGHSSDELIVLVNTLLDLRKVEEGRMDYQFAKTDLVKIVNDVFELERPVAEEKKLQFTFAKPDHAITINADAEKFRQVIQNLVDNAIKYTPEGFVKIGITEDASPDPKKWRVATVAVSDSGYGMSAELIPHLFEEFIRDERVKEKVRGTGLGLFIARKIAEAHGGKLLAKSEGEGKGSTFSVSIPIA